MSRNGSLLPPIESPINTDEKREKVLLFRQNENVKVLLKEEHTDDYISRWLVARNWDVDSAINLFVKSMFLGMEERK